MMSNKTATFKQNDVTRAIKGATAAQMEVGAALIDRDGNILIIAKGEAMPKVNNSVDKLLGMI
jgi:hypothetical protein